MSETPNAEYTPYGETWIEKGNDNLKKIPYRFNAKELDEETGLYYYGARYLNPTTSRWISADPAGMSLINPMKNGKPKQGYSIIEAVNWFSYTSNNPVRYNDPTGMESADAAYSWHKAIDSAPDFSWPVEKGRITSAPGSRAEIKYKDKNGKTHKTKPIHGGIDIAPETPGGNDAFNYIGSGKISNIGYDSVRGNFDTVDHGDGCTSSYFHEDMPSLYRKGDSVDSSNKASMGNTGASTNTHLHLELRKNGELMDPSIFLGKRPEGMLLTPGIGETSSGVLYNEKK